MNTTSGVTAVQIVYSSRRRRGSRDIEHLGSAHDDMELELLKAATRQRLAAGREELDWAWRSPSRPAQRGGGPMAITSSRMRHLLDSLERAYRALGFAEPCMAAFRGIAGTSSTLLPASGAPWQFRSGDYPGRHYPGRTTTSRRYRQADSRPHRRRSSATLINNAAAAVMAAMVIPRRPGR